MQHGSKPHEYDFLSHYNYDIILTAILGDSRLPSCLKIETTLSEINTALPEIKTDRLEIENLKTNINLIKE